MSQKVAKLKAFQKRPTTLIEVGQRTNKGKHKRSDGCESSWDLMIVK